jgi:dihydrofolate reductase
MQSKIVYYVAVSIDGFIAGLNDDVSSFLYEGEGVERYKSDLLEFDTVFMGRKTYEAGFKFGLEPGRKAYPEMQNYVFSKNLHLNNCEEGLHVCKLDVDLIDQVKRTSTKDIYLCGGGKLAEWFLANDLIDEIKIKVNPIILGKGVKLFNNLSHTKFLKLKESNSFDEGLMILSYEVLKQNK